MYIKQLPNIGVLNSSKINIKKSDSLKKQLKITYFTHQGKEINWKITSWHSNSKEIKSKFIKW